MVAYVPPAATSVILLVSPLGLAAVAPLVARQYTGKLHEFLTLSEPAKAPLRSVKTRRGVIEVVRILVMLRKRLLESKAMMVLYLPVVV